MNKQKTKLFHNVVSLSAQIAIAFVFIVFIENYPSYVQAQEPSKMVSILPLGKPNLKETRETKEITKGIINTKIVRGIQSEKEVYVVDIAFCSDLKKAMAIAKDLKMNGFHPKLETVWKRAQDDPEQAPLGYLIRIGAFKTENDAMKLKKELSSKGYQNLEIQFTGEDGAETTGRWVIHVLEINPKSFKGKIVSQLGTGLVPGREKVSEIVARTNAIAAINGGYFVMESNYGTIGDLAGVSMIRGNLISEAINGRTSAIIENFGKKVIIAPVETHLSIFSPDGSMREIDGINRMPGLIRGCGGIGDTPTERPRHMFTCTDESELIQYTSVFGKSTEPGEGAEAVLDSRGKVIEFHGKRGGVIPKGGLVLSGTMDAANWLRSHVKVGAIVNIKTSILANKRSLPLNKTTAIINGGPRLLRNGNIEITAFKEGFYWKENPEIFYRFGVRRNPRTLLGVKRDGEILLVTVDGRNKDYSIGATLEESAEIMKFLGAIEAVNLDGGGSTTMTMGTQLLTHPSDRTGERPVGDAILIMP